MIISLNHQYPNFYMTMHTYFAEIEEGEIDLLEHLDSKWVSKEDLDLLDWIEADVVIVEELKKIL